MCGRGEFPAASKLADHRGLELRFLIARCPVTHARKPVDIIAGELWDHEDPDAAAEDVVAALEEAGWRLVFVPDDLQERVV